MGYDAVLPAGADFAAGLSFLKRHGGSGVPFTCLNLVSASGERAVFPPFRRVPLGGMQVLVVGVLGEEAFPRDALSGLGWKILPAEKVLAGFLRGTEAKTAGLIVVLSRLSPAENLALARALPGPVIVLSPPPRSAGPPTLFESGSAILHSAGKGTHLLEVTVRPAAARGRAAAGFVEEEAIRRYAEKRRGLLAETAAMEETRRGLYRKTLESYDNAIRDATGKRAISIRRIPLDAGIPDDPDTVSLMAGYREEVRRLARTRTSAPPPAGYLGHAACSGCHPANHAAWGEDPHSRAWNALERRGEATNPDCLPCHVTGYSPGGAATPPGKRSASSEGVGCEACHGPGKGHPGRRMKVPGESVCSPCHAGFGPFPFGRKRLSLGCVRVSARIR